MSVVFHKPARSSAAAVAVVVSIAFTFKAGLKAIKLLFWYLLEK